VHSELTNFASFSPGPRLAVHLFLKERGRRVKKTPKAEKQAWFQESIETGNLTADTEDSKEK